MSSDFEKSKSLNGNIWRLTPADNRQAELVAQRFSLSPLVARILTSRNILENQVNDFLNPKLQNLMPNPFVLKDMEKVRSYADEMELLIGKEFMNFPTYEDILYSVKY